MTLRSAFAAIPADVAAGSQGVGLDWNAISAIATGTSALVTAVTVVFIALQTVATKRAAQEAKRSADAANAALELARTEQGYSAAQHRQSLFLAVETIRARIDAKMPRVMIYRVQTDSPEWAEPAVDGEARDRNQIIPDAHSSKVVRFPVYFSLVNSGTVPGEVRFSETVAYSSNTAEIDAGQPLLLKPGGNVELVFWVSRTVGEWVAELDRLESSATSEITEFSLFYSSEDDATCAVKQSIHAGGTPLIRDLAAPGYWTFQDGRTNAIAQPETRQYWLSRARNEQLPEMSWSELEVPNTDPPAI